MPLMTTNQNRKYFNDKLLGRFRQLSVDEAVLLLGLYSKIDTDFCPTKENLLTKRINVSVGNKVSELIVTGEKWYNTRLQKGGGGAIDLTMHLYNESFVDAVYRLVSCSLEASREIPDNLDTSLDDSAHDYT